MATACEILQSPDKRADRGLNGPRCVKFCKVQEKGRIGGKSAGRGAIGPRRVKFYKVQENRASGGDWATTCEILQSPVKKADRGRMGHGV